MVQIAVFSAIGLFVLFIGYLVYRALRTFKKLRNPSSGSTNPEGIAPDEKTLALAAKMGGISVAEARRRLGVLETADSETVDKVSKALGSVSPATNAAYTAPSRKYSKNSKTKKKRKAANKSRARNRKK